MRVFMLRYGSKKKKKNDDSRICLKHPCHLFVIYEKRSWDRWTRPWDTWDCWGVSYTFPRNPCPSCPTCFPYAISRVSNARISIEFFRTHSLPISRAPIQPFSASFSSPFLLSKYFLHLANILFPHSSFILAHS